MGIAVRLVVYSTVVIGLVTVAIPFGPFHRCNCRARRGAQSAAIASLRSLHASQLQFRASVATDLDSDGTGEFGFFRELTGREQPRGAEERLDPPLLPASFATVEGGIVQRGDYLYRIDLPTTDGWIIPVTESDLARIDPDRAEREFRIVAWPIDNPHLGNAVFAIDAAGVVYRNVENTAWRGRNAAPPLDLPKWNLAPQARSNRHLVWKPIN